MREKNEGRRWYHHHCCFSHTHLFHLLEHIAYEWWKIFLPFPSHFFSLSLSLTHLLLITAVHFKCVFLRLFFVSISEYLYNTMRNFSLILNNTDGKSFLMKEWERNTSLYFFFFFFFADSLSRFSFSTTTVEKRVKKYSFFMISLFYIAKKRRNKRQWWNKVKDR